MKAVIMAGGEGSRLRPLTCDLPKPMVPVMNVPVLEHIIELLKLHEIRDIYITLAYLPHKIKEYFGNGASLGVDIEYRTEDTPLGTAGSVKNAAADIDDTFLVISGDSLTDADLTAALVYHKSKGAKATIVLTRVEVPLEYGVVITDSNGAITGFLEKPSWGEVFSDTVNTGIYILEPEVLQVIAEHKKSDFSQDIFPRLLSAKVPIFGYVMSGYWCDIGDIRSYMQAHYDVMNGKIRLKTNVREIRKGVWVGKDTVVEPNAEINAPCLIGCGCHIGNGSVIDSYSVLGSNNVVEDEVSIKRGIIWNNCYIEFGSELRGAILCSNTRLKHYVSMFENVVIGENCIINERAIIKPNVKIWPQKSVDSLSVVDRNIIWGSRYAKTIFGENGLSGIINVDISPEFASRLGAAYGSTFSKGSRVVVSSTTSNSARMFKHAFVSGILSVGVEVYNLSSLLTPISRYAISFMSVEGGIHIKLAEDNPNKLKVDFMDSKGIAISRVQERKIENAYFREDFKRCSGSEISRLNNITDFGGYYVRSILNGIDIRRIREKAPKICIISPSEHVISVVIPMLADAGCKVVSFSSESLESTETLVNTVREKSADLGAFIDSNGETLALADNKGNVIKDDLFLTLAALILFKTMPHSEAIIPLSAPHVIDQLAEKYNSRVVRTKISPKAVMEHMLEHNPYKNKEFDKLYQFQLNFDALAGLLKIVEYLCQVNSTLNAAISEIPPFFMSKRNIFCPWELKGKIMRTLITEKRSEKIELVDGVKFMLQNGWVIVLPDAEAPVFRVYAEGESMDTAEGIAEQYIEKIAAILEASNVRMRTVEDPAQPIIHE